MKKIILTILVSFLFCLLYAQNRVNIEEILNKEIEQHDSICLSKYGTDYPAFTVITLKGDTITEKQLSGKVTLINLWFEYCAPCIAEIPALNELYLKYKDHPEFQLISFAREDTEDAGRCVRKFNILYPVCPVSNGESYRLNFNSGFPTNIIIDTQGKIILIKSGGLTEPEKAKEEVLKLEERIASLFTQQNK